MCEVHGPRNVRYHLLCALGRADSLDQVQVYFSIGPAVQKAQIALRLNLMHSYHCRNESVVDDTCIQQVQLQSNGRDEEAKCKQQVLLKKRGSWQCDVTALIFVC